MYVCEEKKKIMKNNKLNFYVLHHILVNDTSIKMS